MNTRPVFANRIAPWAVFVFVLGVFYWLALNLATLIPNPSPNADWVLPLTLLVGWFGVGLWLVARFQAWRRTIAILGLLIGLILGANTVLLQFGHRHGNADAMTRFVNVDELRLK